MIRRKPATAGMLLTAALLAACSSSPGVNRATTTTRADTPGPAQENIAAGGEAAVLGSASTRAENPGVFSSRLAALLRQQRYRSAIMLTARHPDAARKLILQSPPRELDDPAIRFTASALDHLAAIEGSQAWRDTHRWLVERSPQSDRFHRDRAQLLELIQNGEFDRAATIDITALLPPDAPIPLRSEAARLRAIPLILTDQDQPAASLLTTTFNAARINDPISAPTLGLLATEANLRAGDTSTAIELWTTAVSALAENAERDIIEPAVWQRLADIKPPAAAWPSDAQPILTHHSGIDADFEVMLHASIGIGLMQQENHPPALVELKRAETLASTSLIRQQLRINQARCLIAMDQEPAAASVLSSLSTSQHNVIAGQARAILALQQLRLGRGKEALALLQSAASLVEGTKYAPDVAADLGLVSLTLDQTDRGISLLEQAASNFERLNRWEDWLRVQQNLAIFYTETGDSQALRRIQTRIAEFEQTSPSRASASISN